MLQVTRRILRGIHGNVSCTVRNILKFKHTVDCDRTAHVHKHTPTREERTERGLPAQGHPTPRAAFGGAGHGSGGGRLQQEPGGTSVPEQRWPRDGGGVRGRAELDPARNRTAQTQEPRRPGLRGD